MLICSGIRNKTKQNQNKTKKAAKIQKQLSEITVQKTNPH
jgi:hypothetical protein